MSSISPAMTWKMATGASTGQQGGREGDGRHAQEQQPIEEQEQVVGAPDEAEQVVVVDPHDQDGEEAEPVGQVDRPLAE